MAGSVFRMKSSWGQMATTITFVRAFDRNGEALENKTTKTSDKPFAIRFLEKAMKPYAARR